MKGNDNIDNGFLGGYRYAAAAIAVWTIILAASLIWNMHIAKKTTQELAKEEARANFNKDQAFRLWGTKHGGVYVPATKDTPPNPRLSHVPERDIKTPSGKQLTLMNPAYMMRQMMNEFSELYGIKGRITSLKPLYPPNAPDTWEVNALKAFEKGSKEVFEFTEIDGNPYLRLMRPMIATKPCLKCHAFQGYKEGDIMGGVGVSVPMTPYLTIQRNTIKAMITAHVLIWVLGLAVIGFVSVRARSRIFERIEWGNSIRKKEEYYHSIFDSMQDCVCILSPEGKYLSLNTVMLKTNELASFDEALGKSCLDSVIENAEEMATAIKKAYKGEISRLQYKSITKSGKIMWWDSVLTPIKETDGTIKSILRLSRDITASKNNEIQLRQTVETLERTKKACLNIMEDLRNEILARKTAEKELKEKSLQLEDINRTLEKRVQEETAARLEKERIFVHQGRLAAMGEMIGAIAHQWRQPLNAIGLIIQDIKDAYEFGEMNKEYLDATVKKGMDIVNHMSKTIDDFRNFFRQDKEKQSFDVKIAAGEVLSMLSAQLRNNKISYRLSCHEHNRTAKNFTEIIPCDEFKIEAYPNELKQVFMNIVNNAKDAILQRRKEGRMGADEEGLITFDYKKEDNKVIISIADNGGGIPEDIIHRIFEPYFTTKEEDKGTGIGLYMSKMIIEQNMGGRIYAKNKEDGAVFTIELPL